MAVEIIPPFKVYPDRDGSPLEAGYIYVGEPNQDPQSSPIAVFWDAALTQPASQPIRTLNGVASRNGSPSAFFADGDYSIRVNDKLNVTLYSSPSRQVSGLGDIILESGDQLIVKAGATAYINDGASLTIGTEDGGPARLIFTDNARTSGDILPFNDDEDRIGRADLRFNQAFIREVASAVLRSGALELNVDGAIDGVIVTNTLSGGGEVRARRIYPRSSLDSSIGTASVPFNTGAVKTLSANDFVVLRTAQPATDADLLRLNARALDVAGAKVTVSAGVATLQADSFNVGSSVNYNSGTASMQLTLTQPISTTSRVQVTAWRAGTPLIVKARVTSSTLIDIGFVDAAGSVADPEIVNVTVTGPGSASGAGSIAQLPF